MYSRYNLKIYNKEEYLQCADRYHRSQEYVDNLFKKQIEEYLYEGILSGTMLQENWFPEIEADIFIAHSHNDEKLAKGISVWLKENFELTTFIDSSVWGFSNDLLKKINNSYCIQDYDPTLYDYEKRNYSTSHVYLMLQIALYKMIDKVESVFVLNTDNSIQTIPSISNTVKNKTSSPWIYSELVASKLIRQRPLSDFRTKVYREDAMESKLPKDFSKSLDINYDVDLSHLKEITDEDLIKWKKKYIGFSQYSNIQETALDFLYNIVK